MDYIVGIDLGTTNFKSLIVDTAGNVVFKAALSVETRHPQKGFAEQNPDYLWHLIKELLTKTVKNTPKKPIAVGFSAAMHSLMALDANNNPLTNAIIWADNRAEKQAFELNKSRLGNTLFRVTGTPIHPLSPLLKLVWLRENEPDIFNKTAWFCSIKEFVFHQLFGKKIVDLSVASATGLMHSNHQKWHKPSLKMAQVVDNQLSKIVSPYHVELLKANDFIPEWENVPFVIGASDGVLSSLSAGAIDDNLTTITIGTSGAVRRIVKKGPLSIKAKKGSKLFKYCLDEQYFVLGGATNNGGIALEWLTKKIINSALNNGVNSDLNALTHSVDFALNNGVNSDLNTLNNGVDFALNNGVNSDLNTLNNGVDFALNNGVNSNLNALTHSVDFAINNSVNSDLNALTHSVDFALNNGVNSDLNTLTYSVDFAINNGVNSDLNALTHSVDFSLNNGVNADLNALTHSVNLALNNGVNSDLNALTHSVDFAINNGVNSDLNALTHSVNFAINNSVNSDLNALTHSFNLAIDKSVNSDLNALTHSVNFAINKSVNSDLNALTHSVDLAINNGVNSDLNALTHSVDFAINKSVNSDLNVLIKSAERVDIGSDNLLFIPFILGERALIWDANARGAFLNLSFEHTQAHFVRATLEGILFNLQHIHAAIEAELSETTAIFADGGFMQSPFLIQMLADITNKPIHTRTGEDGGSLGAIMMSMHAINLSENLLETTKILKPTKVVYPSENAVLYRTFFENYLTVISSIIR